MKKMLLVLSLLALIFTMGGSQRVDALWFLETPEDLSYSLPAQTPYTEFYDYEGANKLKEAINEKGALLFFQELVITYTSYEIDETIIFENGSVVEEAQGETNFALNEAQEYLTISVNIDSVTMAYIFIYYETGIIHIYNNFEHTRIYNFYIDGFERQEPIFTNFINNIFDGLNQLFSITIFFGFLIVGNILIIAFKASGISNIVFSGFMILLFSNFGVITTPIMVLSSSILAFAFLASRGSGGGNI